MASLLAATGRGIFWLLEYLGQLTILLKEMGASILFGRMRWRLLGEQVVNIGFGSQLVVVVTGAFTGAVFAAQTYFKFSSLGLGSGVGAVVSIAMCRELGPVLTGLMLAGRVGAAMAAEIGTMKVTEQIDALRSMGVHPVDYLVIPRVFAMFLSVPLLVAESIGFGLLASHWVAVYGFNVPAAWYDHHVLAHTALIDVSMGMIKGTVFGAIIVLISCHQGLNATNGAVGVGQGTTKAVVFSSLALLVVNFFLSLILNTLSPLGGYD